MIPSLTLILLDSKLAVCRLPAEAPVPEWASMGDLLAIVRTRDELSIVCDQTFVPAEIKAETGWRVLKVKGPLDFSLIGVLAALSQPLARAGVSLFAISTFDTDYILVKEQSLDQAVQVLRQDDLTVIV